MGKNLFIRKSIFVREIVLVILLILFWVLLSGKYDFFHLLLGAASIIIVVLINRRIISLDLYYQERGVSAFRIHRLILYIPWLIWEIILSSVQVAVIILSPKMPINPSMIRFKVNLPNMTSKVILGNSISLTPGTLTIDIEGDEFLVHALSDDSFELISSGELPDYVSNLFRADSKDTLQSFKIIRTVDDL